MAIHHSLALLSSHCHSAQTLTNKAETEAEACHTQVGVRETRQTDGEIRRGRKGEQV